jgi:hypothetical protein
MSRRELNPVSALSTYEIRSPLLHWRESHFCLSAVTPRGATQRGWPRLPQAAGLRLTALASQPYIRDLGERPSIRIRCGSFRLGASVAE